MTATQYIYANFSRNDILLYENFNGEMRRKYQTYLNHSMRKNFKIKCPYDWLYATQSKEYTLQEIANKLNMSENQVESIIEKFTRLLKKRISREEVKEYLQLLERNHHEIYSI